MANRVIFVLGTISLPAVAALLPALPTPLTLPAVAALLLALPNPFALPVAPTLPLPPTMLLFALPTLATAIPTPASALHPARPKPLVDDAPSAASLPTPSVKSLDNVAAESSNAAAAAAAACRLPRPSEKHLSRRKVD